MHEKVDRPQGYDILTVLKTRANKQFVEDGQDGPTTYLLSRENFVSAYELLKAKGELVWGAAGRIGFHSARGLVTLIAEPARNPKPVKGPLPRDVHFDLDNPRTGDCFTLKDDEGNRYLLSELEVDAVMGGTFGRRA